MAASSYSSSSSSLLTRPLHKPSSVSWKLPVSTSFSLNLRRRRSQLQMPRFVVFAIDAKPPTVLVATEHGCLVDNAHTANTVVASTMEAQEGVAIEVAEALVGALKGELAATAVNAPMVPAEVETLLDQVKWDEKGLAVAIAQNIDTGAILMQGFANREALATTISSRKATFFSRSRSTLWTKGETSMNYIHIHDIFLDCDRDSIIYLGKPDGPTCHTGSETCYYSSVFDFIENPQAEDDKLALTTLYSLETTISQRKAEISSPTNGKPSWTKRLLVDQDLICSKIREEADELCRTLEDNEDKSRTASEMADVLYHTMVLLALKEVQMEDVLQILRERFSRSGIEEKKSRKQPI